MTYTVHAHKMVEMMGTFEIEAESPEEAYRLADTRLCQGDELNDSEEGDTEQDWSINNVVDEDGKDMDVEAFYEVREAVKQEALARINAFAATVTDDDED